MSDKHRWQSGDPAFPHYDDHAISWAERGDRPLLWSKQAVEDTTRLHVLLEPVLDGWP